MPSQDAAMPECPMKDLEIEALRLSNQLCFAVYSTAHALNRVYKPLLEPLSLTYPQYLVMLTLWEKDNVSVKEIGTRLHLDSGTLTPLLKRLEQSDFVTRRRDAEDERQVRIELTSRGLDLRGQAKSIPREILCATGGSLDEIVSLRDELIALRDRLNAGPAAV
jgi:MarR family transcriptional regulator, organic hydroperoxide resistance regulator